MSAIRTGTSHSVATFLKLLLAIALMAVGASAYAVADPDNVSFTLEGCRNDGSILLPNGAGKFVCPDAAYTTGNLGKGWNELDLVPHRIHAKAGNSAPLTQTYAVVIAADNCDAKAGSPQTCPDGSAGYFGYDVIGSDGGGTPVLNTALSDASCTALSSSAQLVETPGQGGISSTIYRILTITQPRNTECVYDYYERLALGSHLFPGSALHSNLLNQNLGEAGIGSKEVSIPVKEISPQSLAKDMTASEPADNQWSITKVGTPAKVSFGDVCAADAPKPQGVTLTVTWTVTQTAGDINVTTHVYATNPASRTITANVTDDIYANQDQTTKLSTNGPVSADVPANSTVLVLTDTQTYPSGTAGLGVGSYLNDVATATYTDKATGIPVPGQTTATASAKIAQGDITNTTVDVLDEESISGTGLTFSVDSPLTGYLNGYVAGTATVGPVDWAALLQTSGGSVIFGKTIYLDTKRVTSGTLSDTAAIFVAGTNTQLGNPALVSIPIDSSASASLTINKTVPDILGAGEKFEITFHIARANDVSYSKDVTLTFNPGDTSKSTTITGLVPDQYIVTETGNLWYANGSNVGVPGLLAPVGSNQQTADLSVKDGIPTCSGSVSFDNALAQGFAHAQVQKITDPELNSNDPDYNWDFTLLNPDGTVAAAKTAGAGAGYVAFGVDLVFEGTYTVQETTKTGWDLNSASPNDGVTKTVCSFTVNYPQDEGNTFSCTFKNTKRGQAQVIKTVQKGALTGTQSFTFQLRQGASTLSDGTILEQKDATALNSGNITFSTLLVPGDTYQLCEIVMPGWNTDLGTYGTLFVPNSIIPPALPNPNVNNMTVCVNFTVDAGATKTFNVDNSPPPGGRALTIGFWKNWASCTSSSTNKKPTLDVTLYNYLPNGIPVGNVLSVVPGHTSDKSFFGQNPTKTADCAHAVSLLSKNDFNGKKRASDPLFNMAAQLVAAELNLAAGAYSCPPVVNAIGQANALLSSLSFTGFGYTGTLLAADATKANTLATELDNYNNNNPIACQ